MSRTTGQVFTQSYIELHKVRQVQFGLLAPEEVKRMSVVKVEVDRIYDEQGLPNLGGINDPRMGTMDKEMKCYTCKGTHQDCPGHFGHIELAKPVYHGGFIEFINKVLRCVCNQCSRILLDKERRPEILKIKNQAGRFNRVSKFCEAVGECKQEAGGCGLKKPKYSKKGLGIVIQHTDDRFSQNRTDTKEDLVPEEAWRILSGISDEDCVLMGLRPEISRPENMIIKNLPVAPPPVRPNVVMSSSNRSEDDLTYSYQKILQSNNSLILNLGRGANLKTQAEIRQELQYYVATLMDNEIQGQATHKHKSGKPLKAIRARLRGKEGRLRGNLMGKRVDFSSRSVITPDPILQLDQLGVPYAIAINLTVPETVTTENIDEMRRLVENGPNIWPGAKYIHRPDGQHFDISQLKNRSDSHLEPGYKVERHLRNNDYVIFNRQPSLHKMSLMGHRVKVLPYSTFRLNLSVTTPYNADFDGDEMNMHVPQSYETMAEVKEIMAVPNQIVSPKDNKPVMGIVQDALLGVMLFTRRDTFIEKELVMNLLMWAGYEEDKFPQPCIIKPKPLWSGKQIFSLIIPKINMEKGSNSIDVKDDSILIKNGELLTGILTKGTIGSSSGGMIHIIWKEKGPFETKEFMSKTQLLINNWLHQTGFTVGVEDIIATKETLNKIKIDFKENMKKVKEIVYKAQTGQLEQQPGKSMLDSFEFMVNSQLNLSRDQAGNYALEKLFMWNRLKAMVTAGSKGSNLNISQIMACVGQQNVEGKRIPFGFSQRTLPHFSKDDFGPESKGFVKNCYLTGLTPQEFFFHAMGGREGLIDTAVKTAETGYIQRRLIKALEDVMVKYDGTVRTSKEQVIQFLYGEDGFAAEYIEDMSIQLMDYNNDQLENYARLRSKEKTSDKIQRDLSTFLDPEIAQEIANDAQLKMRLDNEFDQLRQDREDLRHIILCKQGSNLIHFPVNLPRIIWNAKEQFKIKHNSVTDLHPNHVLDSLKNLFEEVSAIPGMQIRRDPLLMQARENSTWLFKIYLRSMLNTKSMIQKERLSQHAFDWVIGEIKSRFDQAIANPGEMVGPIAAQSIGEPATQMTLNTFHNAGISSKNVTLGVPRIKEIINVAKNIKTPTLKIFLLPEYKHDQNVAQSLLSQLEHTTLSNLVSASQIFYDPDPNNTIIKDDEQLVISYNDVRPDNAMDQNEQFPPWVMRFQFDKWIHTRNLFMDKIASKITETFLDQIEEMHSDDNADKLVMRLRIKDIQDDEENEEESTAMYLKEIMDKILNEVTISGIPEITKVTFTKYNETEYDPVTGALIKHESKETPKCWQIETDGVALSKVLGFEKIDFKRTSSNDIQEILKVLGIEAVRLALINEIRFVLGSYGIYVNYRHLSTLCDVMTQRGILTSITRHGINRVDTGPLRKCSFEETVEILYEAAFYAETDFLTGITENIIMGQLAPYGTGCFDLVVDTQTLKDFAQDKPEDQDSEYVPGFTPIDDNEGGMHIDTPIAQNTPNHPYIYGGPATPGTDYAGANTPNYQGAMSPGGMYGQSPAYMSPSYTGVMGGGSAMSPAYRPGQSPIYGAQSPIYQPTAGGSGLGMMSPAPHQSSQSPSYSPTNSRQSPSYARQITPAYMGGSGMTSGAVSPHYDGRRSTAGGAYNPAGSLGAGVSPSYSPTSYHQASPRYSPTTPMTPNYNRALNQGAQSYSPQYSPASGASPRYNAGASSSHHQNIGGGVMPSPAGAGRFGTTGGPASSLHHQGTPVSPGASGAYIPSSPMYNANIGGGPVGRPSYLGGGVSPIEDSMSENEATPNPNKQQ